MSEQAKTEDLPRSIHWRQRWWYVTWVVLLLSSLAFWAWWEHPARSGSGHVVMKVWVRDIPAGSKVEIWTGPAAKWNGQATDFQGPWVVNDPAQPLPLPPITLTVALRHWDQGYIPRRTTDRVVMRFDPPQGPPRFAAYNLEQDLNGGLAGIHRKLFLSLPLKWAALSQDASTPTPLLP